MALASGTKLGPYEIVAALGAGVMGEVYRATDTRLGRDVAVKVLPQHLSDSPEVRARFEREARTVSSLNHPHICTLFDVGREGDTDYLVMELVEGETLAQRLSKGALTTTEVFRFGAQIADALDRAHRAGVVHRDLKPANVMLTHSGAKLMDFGLARATGLAAPGGMTQGGLTQSPTVAQPLTAEGTLVGTFQYMSPEQLEGREADARSDLWAFGAILYEMATGKQPFEGRSQASLIGAIMNAQPTPLSQLAPLAPPALERLVSACLAKDPNERIQTAHDAKLNLEWSADGPGPTRSPVAAAARPASGARLAWFVAAVLALTTVALVVTLLGRPADRAGTMRVSVPPPAAAIIDEEELHTSISPDGAMLVFVATDSAGMSQLWLRELENTAARPLPGTEEAILPFWSPDSRFIGFFAEGKLKKIDVAGKDVQALCAAPDGRGGSWSPNGTVLFTSASTGGLQRVSASGGEVTVVTAPDTSHGEASHRFPCFLPDGEHFLYSVLSSRDDVETRLGSLHDRTTRFVLRCDGSSRYAAPDHLMFARKGVLLVQGFDARTGRLRGEPRALGPASTLSRYAGGPPGSVSTNGIIEQRSRSIPLLGLAWFDREGRRLGTVPMSPDAFSDLALSRDDTRAALIRHSPDGDADVWVVELARGLAARLTTDLVSCEQPVWSPDGRWVMFSCFMGGRRSIDRRLASGSGAPETYWHGLGAFEDPYAWSGDGRTLFIRDLGATTGEDVWALRDEGGLKRFPVLTSRFHEEDPSPSPDGHWLAYRSDESGRSELYVQSYPTPDTKVRISAEGAGTGTRTMLGCPHWRRDGRELVYVSGDGVTVVSVPVEAANGFHMGAPRALFHIPPGCRELVPSSDLQRFLVLEQRASVESGSIQLIVNWPAGDRPR